MAPMISFRLLAILVLFHPGFTAFSQSFRIPVQVSDNGGVSMSVNFGQDPASTYCIDDALGESELPPLPIRGVLDVRWLDSHAASTCLGTGTRLDLRPGDDSYILFFQPGPGGYPFTLSWPSLDTVTAKAIMLTDVVGGSIVNVDMKAQTSCVITNAAIDRLRITVGAPPPPVLLAPAAGTGLTYSYSQTSAHLPGRVNPNGSPTYAWFEWGLTDSYGNSTVAELIGDGSAHVDVSAEITGLLPQTRYQYRVVAENASGITYSGGRSFVTVPAGETGEFMLPIGIEVGTSPPRTLWIGVHMAATTCVDEELGEIELPPVPPTGVFDARLNDPAGLCGDQGRLVDVRRYFDADHGDEYIISFQRHLTSDQVTLTWPDASGWFNGSLVLKDRITGTIVSVDMRSQNSVTVTHALISSLSVISGDPAPPLPAAPFVATGVPDETGQISTRLHGTVIPNGAETFVWFEWGATVAYGNATGSVPAGAGTGALDVSNVVAGLSPQETYHYRVVAQNAIDTVYGADNVFTTIATGEIGGTLFRLTVSDNNSHERTLWLGAHDAATSCIDPALGEVELPPRQPSGVFDIRLLAADPGCTGAGMIADIRDLVGASQVDTFVLSLQPATYGPVPLYFEWDDLSEWFSGDARLRDPFGWIAVDVDMTTTTEFALGDWRITTLYVITGPAASGAPPPAALTNPASSIAVNQATVGADVNPKGFSTLARFEYGPTAAYGSQTIPTGVGDGEGVVTLDELIGGLAPNTTYHYRIVAENVNGTVEGPDLTFTTTVVSGVEETAAAPRQFLLRQNYPNPFNPSTTIEFDLPEASFTTLTVYNLFGEVVRILVDEPRPAGRASLVFDATGLPSGVYYYRLRAGAYSDTRKLLLLK